MSRAISMRGRMTSRFAIEPVMLALVVVGGVGAYAVRDEPGAAAKPLALPVRPAALKISYAQTGLDEAGFARVVPAQAVQALQQAAAFRPAPAPLAASFEDAFSPMTAVLEVREPQLGPVAAPTPARVAVPAKEPVPALALPPAPVAAPGPVAQVDVVMAPAPTEAALATSVLPAAIPASPGGDNPGLVPASAAEPAAEQAADDTALAGSSAAVAALDLAPKPALDQGPQASPAPALASSETAVPLVSPVPAVAPAAPVAGPRLAVPVARPVAAAPSTEPAPEAGEHGLVRPAKAAPAAKFALAHGKTAAVIGPQIPSRYKLIDGGVESRIGIQLYGERIGALPLRVMGSGVPSLRLGDLLGLLRGRIDPARYETLAGSAAAEEFVSLDTLRKAGIPVRYDAARDELKLGQE